MQPILSASASSQLSSILTARRSTNPLAAPLGRCFRICPRAQGSCSRSARPTTTKPASAEAFLSFTRLQKVLLLPATLKIACSASSLQQASSYFAALSSRTPSSQTKCTCFFMASLDQTIGVPWWHIAEELLPMRALHFASDDISADAAQRQ